MADGHRIGLIENIENQECQECEVSGSVVLAEAKDSIRA